MINKIVFDWRIKLFLEKVVSFLPFGFDYKIYSYFGHKFLDINVSSLEERIEKGMQNLELIREKTNIDYENKTIFELGTGLHGVDLLLFYVLGCGKIITLDHIVHLRKDLMISVIQFLAQRLEDLSIRFNQNIEYLKDRLNRIKTNGSLNDLLTSCNTSAYDGIVPEIEYIDKKSVDVFYSESCLQRIPLRKIIKIFVILPNLLSKNAISFHRIDSNDFNSMYFQKLWRLNYLKYSDFLWSLMTAEKFNSQNRLREHEFISLLESSELKTLYVESIIKSEDVEKIKTFSVAKKFIGIPSEELAIAHSKIISTKASVKDQTRKRIGLEID